MKKLFKTVGKIISAIAAIAVLIWAILILWPSPVFGPEHDVELGKQVVQSIAETGQEGPVLSREDYPEAYEHLDRLVAKLVESPYSIVPLQSAGLVWFLTPWLPANKV